MPYDAARPELPIAHDRVSAPAVRTIGPRPPKPSKDARVIVIPKSVTETRTANTTLQSDGELFISMLVGERIAFRFKIFYTTPAAADFKYQLVFPTGGDCWILSKELPPNAVNFSKVAFVNAAAQSILSAGGTDGYVEVEGRLNNLTNAGNLAFYWAQNTSDAGNTLVLLGSSLEYWKF